MKKNNFFWSFILIIIILSVSGAVVLANKINNPDENEILKSKVRDEMNYLDGKISSMLNGLNNISLTNYIVEEKEISSQEGTTEANKSNASEEANSASKGEEDTGSQNGQSSSQSGGESGQSKEPKNITEMNNNNILKNDRKTDWKEIQTTVENLHSTWATILLDLYKLEINNDDILKFSQLLDQLTLNIKNEQKIESLDTLTQMYSCVVGYIHSFEKDDELYKNVAKTREAVFYAYAQVDNDNWNEVQVQLQNAENSYIIVVNNVYNKEKEFTINKAYITLKELQNCIDEKDKDVFYIKYKNVLEELNFLMG